MSLISLIIALLLEQWRPLSDRRNLLSPLTRYAAYFEQQFNAGEAYQGQLAWALAVVPLVVVTWLVYWLALVYRIVYARFGHYYRLTTRRLFVSTGLMHRRRDQLELLRIKDVFTRQRLTERWLSIGTVVVVPDDQALPTFYLAGVDDPKAVMDLVWHHSRAQREGSAVQVENL